MGGSVLIGLGNHSAVLWFVLAVATTLFLCIKAFPVGSRLSVLAHPDEERRWHKSATPQVGGIAILAGVMVWVCGMLLTDSSPEHHLLFAIAISALGVGAIGFADDQTGLSPLARVVMLLVVLGAAFVVDNEFMTLKLNWKSFDPTTISIWVYVPLMALTAGGIVNAVNMVDGQDGIAGSMLAVWSGCLFLVSSGASAVLAGLICVSTLVFLAFNLRGKIFLGDCGSYGVTFVLGLLVTLAHARGHLMLETIIVWFFIPVADCLRLMISRPLRGRSPFLADRDHFHHRLEDKMGKHKGLACYAAAVAAASVVATLEPRFALVCLCLLCAFYFSFAWLTDANVAAEATHDTALEEADNVIRLSAKSAPDRTRKGAA